MLRFCSFLLISSCLFPTPQAQQLDERPLPVNSDVGSLFALPEDHHHLLIQPATPAHNIPGGFLFDFLSDGSDSIHRKIEMLSEVHDSVLQLFENVISRRRDGLPGELFNQLKIRAVEKIFNLKFLLQTVDRLVHERLHMERMADVFATLANKRTNDSQLLVTQIHRNAAELAESIRTDLGRAIDQVDGVTGGGLFGLGLGLGSPLLAFSPFSSLIDKITGLQKFRVQKGEDDFVVANGKNQV